MKRVLYTDFRFHYKVHASHLDPARSYTGPDVLFVSHELSLTGAPRMLFYAAKAVLADGGFPVVTAPKDGPMRQELVEAGIAVIIDESITHNHFLFGSFAKNFDAVVVNTIALDGVVRQLQQFEDLKLIWWMHEAQVLKTTLAGRRDIDLERVRLLCVSEYAKDHVPAGYSADVLYNGVPDQQGCVPAASRQPAGFTFVLAGTIEPRKGQDIFAAAILLLPEEVRSACRFVLTGKLWDMHVPFWQDIQASTRNVKQLEYLGLLEHRKVLECMAGADVVVCASRDEAFSLTAIEAAMLGKPVIVSRSVGVSRALEREAAGLLFESGDAASLAAQLQHAFEHADEMRRMGARARQAYEREVTLETVSQEFLSHIRR
jgi:glycosyltransferase involved in cell wall biosynthesis